MNPSRLSLVVAALAVTLVASPLLANDGIDRICTPEELPSVTRPHVELSRLFTRSEVPAEDPYTAPMGAVEVVLARVNADGKVELSCVDTEAAAREFFKAPFARTKSTAEEK
jgi:hypothetical protein